MIEKRWIVEAKNTNTLQFIGVFLTEESASNYRFAMNKKLDKNVLSEVLAEDLGIDPGWRVFIREIIWETGK